MLYIYISEFSTKFAASIVIVLLVATFTWRPHPLAQEPDFESLNFEITYLLFRSEPGNFYQSVIIIIITLWPIQFWFSTSLVSTGCVGAISLFYFAIFDAFLSVVNRKTLVWNCSSFISVNHHSWFTVRIWLYSCMM